MNRNMKRVIKRLFKSTQYGKYGWFIAILVLGIVCFDQYSSTNKKLEMDQVQMSKCTDGDTAHMLIEGVDQTVRFIAIDTPETVKPNTPVQPYGKEASEYTCQSLLSATNIDLEYEESNKTDKYGRVIAWVFVDGKLLQEELISQGLAKVDYIYGNYKYTDRLYKAEELAKQQKLGIWKDK